MKIRVLMTGRSYDATENLPDELDLPAGTNLVVGGFNHAAAALGVGAVNREEAVASSWGLRSLWSVKAETWDMRAPFVRCRERS